MLRKSTRVCLVINHLSELWGTAQWAQRHGNLRHGMARRGIWGTPRISQQAACNADTLSPAKVTGDPTLKQLVNRWLFPHITWLIIGFDPIPILILSAHDVHSIYVTLFMSWSLGVERVWLKIRVRMDCSSVMRTYGTKGVTQMIIIDHLNWPSALTIYSIPYHKLSST